MTVHFRLQPIRSKKVLNSAKGSPCSGRFPGICNSNPETTVWAHLNGLSFGKGMSVKAHDIFGLHLCSDCHRYLDVGHGTKPLISDATLYRCLLIGVCETYLSLVLRDIIKVPLDPEPPPMLERPVKPRKPPEERQKIQSAPKWPPKGSRKLQSRNTLRRAD